MIFSDPLGALNLWRIIPRKDFYLIFLSLALIEKASPAGIYYYQIA
jgi:hypothetical protein